MTIARFLFAVSFISVLFFFEPVASADKANETAFARLLVEKSPWSVTWVLWEVSLVGTHKISFVGATDGTTLTGRIFDNSRGSSPGPLMNITLKNGDGHKNCVQFKSPAGFKYNYCLTEEGTLKGTVKGVTISGYDVDAEVVAKPKE